jgi:hypothetical protein
MVSEPIIASSLSYNFDQRLDRLESSLGSTMRDMRELFFAALNSRFDQLVEACQTTYSTSPKRSSINATHGSYPCREFKNKNKQKLFLSKVFFFFFFLRRGAGGP